MGFEVHLLTSIVGVMSDDGDNDYLDKISRLAMRRGEFSDVPPLPHGGLAATLREAMRRQRVVKIVRAYGEGDALCGIVRAMTDDTMSVQTVDQYGEDGGLATVLVRGVASVHLGTEEEQILDYLRESYARNPDARLVG